MRSSCRVVWFLAVAACGGSHGNRPDGGSIDGSIDGSLGGSIDAAADAPVDGAVGPVVCSPLVAPRIATSSVPTGVAVADVNGDGKPDLVVTLRGGLGPVPTEPPELDVMLGNGDGSFQPAQRTVINVDAGATPMAPVIADIDGDGHLDVVIAFSGLDASAVQLVLGDGQGNFTPGDRLAGAFVSSVALADLDRDGRIDIITVSANVTNGVSILFGTGGGSFAAPIALDAGTAYDSVAIHDVDRDQVPDVVASGASLGVFRGRGDRTFEAPFKTALAGDSSHQVAVGDFDGDGIPDIVTASLVAVDQALILETWLGSGAGTFAKRAERWLGPDHPSDLPPPFNFQPPFPGVLALADFDGDTKLDVAVTFMHRDVVDFIKGTGTGDLPPVIEFATGREPTALAGADVNRDGRFDLIATDTTQHIEVMLGTPNGIFRAPRGIRSFDDNVGIPVELAVGDIDGDGQLDFAEGTTAFDVQQVEAIRVAGSGGGRSFYFLPQHAGHVSNERLFWRDIDGDGDLDMIVSSSGPVTGNAGVSVFFNPGNGMFGSRIGYMTQLTTDLAIGDLDGDQRPELVVAAVDGLTNEGSITVLKNDGTGTFSPQPPFPGQGPMLLQDFNRDGRLDLVTYGSTSISVRLGKGDGTFESPIDTELVGIIRLVVADVNDDGVPDLAGETATQTLVLTGNGDGTFTSAGTLPAAPGGLLALANLDNVAPLDVVGRLGAIYRAGSDTRTDDWTIGALEVRDVTGDGHLDVLGVGFSLDEVPRSNAVFVLASQCP